MIILKKKVGYLLLASSLTFHSYFKYMVILYKEIKCSNVYT